MQADKHQTLSRRERQIMDALYRLGQATVGEVMELMTDPPSYSTFSISARESFSISAVSRST